MSSVTERTLVTDLAGLPDVPGGDRAAVVGHDWVRGPRLGCGQVRPTGWRSWSWRRSAIPWPGLPPGCPTAVLLVMLWFLFPGMAEQVSPRTTGRSSAAGPGTGSGWGRTPTWTGQVADLSGRVRS